VAKVEISSPKRTCKVADAPHRHLKKSILVAMVKRQEDKWPGPDVYGDRSTTISRLRKVLLDPRYGFTKETVSVARHRSLSTVTPLDTSGNSSSAPYLLFWNYAAKHSIRSSRNQPDIYYCAGP
jgi:hypothetical protein